jgi:hypothetical protein
MRNMSMPVLPDIQTREEAVNAILSSIALEETALSHIINAEGEKIQFALEHTKGLPNTDLQMILKINESAALMLEQITDMQLVLISKLSKILRNACPVKPGADITKPLIKPPCKPVHKPPIKPPCSGKPQAHTPCVSEFKASTRYDWCGRSPLMMTEVCACGGAELREQRAGSYIKLPAGKKYRISFDIELINGSGQNALLEVRLDYGALDFKTKDYPFEGRYIHLKDTVEWAVPQNHLDGAFRIKLLTPKQVKICGGDVTVTEI